MSEQKSEQALEFHLGAFGRFIPVIIAVIFIVIAGLNQSNVSGYVIAFFVAVIASVPFAKNQKAYGEAVVSGLVRPIFCIISVAVIMASIAGKLVSSSGLIQTLASFVIGANFTGGLFAAFSFFICCVLSMSTGTSVGTNIVSFPILFPVGVMAGVGPGFMAGALVSGALFGDNLAPISDTTIASAGSQNADMGGVVRTRVWYSVPAAIAVFVIELLFAGRGGNVAHEVLGDLNPNPLSLVMLVVPLVIIMLCFMQKHLIFALCWGNLAGIVVGLVSGLYKFSDVFSYPGGFKVEGIFIDAITGSAGTVMMLYGVFCLLGLMEKSGVVESIGRTLIKLARGVRGTETVIVLTIGVMSWITGVIAVGMVALGDVIAEMGEKAGINKYRRANLMDCGGIGLAALVPWTVHTVLPAQLASGSVESINIIPTDVIIHNFYSMALLVILIISIVTGYGRNRMPISKAEKVGS